MTQPERIQELFHEALELPTSERAGFLDRTCPSAEVRAEVESLLQALGDAGTFLNESEAVPEAERQGTMIGRYKLLQEIGQGGFGVVWMAEQVEPVRRRVALKIIKLGMDTRQVVARFEAERQALALMEHPNIARVLDGGSTVAGRPYFVMELVPGVPITEFCDRANLGTPERIRLFQSVCEAVQHAHQKGVIHRDLKPSNILVTLHDGAPVPKVIDFGIAKATNQELTQRTLFTEFRQMIGTPEYMAPEQAELSGLDVDTRADVYSLGVVLYELLTGTKPFELSTLATLGYEEVLRQIREVDPPKPSTRVSTLGDDLGNVAQKRGVEPERLGRLFRGDLDWIVMRALEKERGRRYATARALARDLGCHLEDLPVEAGPPSRAYRMAKFARRNKGPVTAAAVVLLALLAGIVGTGLALQRARSAERDARQAAVRADGEAERSRQAAERALAAQQQEQAERERAEASERQARAAAQRTEAVLRLTQEMLASANPHSTHRPGYTVRELLDDFDRGLERRVADQPAVEAEVRAVIGSAYRALGVLDKAEAHLQRALADWDQGVGEEVRFAQTLWQWGWLLHDRGKYAAAEEAMRRVVDIARRHQDEDPWLLAETNHALADLMRHQGRFAEAEALARESLDRIAESGLPGTQYEAVNLSVLALAVQAQGRTQEAEALHRKSLALFRELVGDRHPAVGMGWNNLGAVLSDQARHAEAEEAHRIAVACNRDLYGEVDHPSTASSLANLALALLRQRRHPEAEKLARESLEMRQRLLPEVHPEVVSSLQVFALALNQQGKYETAEPLQRRVLSLRRAIHRDDHPRIAEALLNLAGVLRGCKRHTEAEAAAREALEIYGRLGRDDHPSALTTRLELASSLRAQGRRADQEEELVEHLRLARRRFGQRHSRLAAALEWLGVCQIERERYAEAEATMRESVAIREANAPESWSRWVATSLLGWSVARQKRFAEAEPLIVQGYEEMTVPKGYENRKASALKRVVWLYENWAEEDAGKAVLAARWRDAAAAKENGDDR